MIQDILGGSYLLGDEKKILSTILEGTPTSFPAAPAATATATVPTSGAANASTTSSTSENLRCPRCHSANTKFCYYNNYNLTQPRHFCKSCRRYWTKGGALRNVPIGGGCRKSKVGSALPNSAARSSSKFRNMASEIGRFSFEQDLLQPAPALWAPTQNSPLLSLLKTAAKQNHNPNVLLPSLVKAEPFFGIGHTVSEQSRSTNVRPVGFSDPLGPSHMALDLSRNDRQNGLLVPNAPGIQELYQRLRLSGDSGSEPFNGAAVVTGGGSCSNSSPLAGQGPAASAAGGEFRFWNYNVPAFASSDLSNN